MSGAEIIAIISVSATSLGGLLIQYIPRNEFK